MLQFDYQLYSILRAFPDNSEKKNEVNANMGTQRIGGAHRSQIKIL